MGGLFEKGLNRGFMVVAGHNLGTFVHCLHPLSLFTYLLIFKTVRIYFQIQVRQEQVVFPEVEVLKGNLVQNNKA